MANSTAKPTLKTTLKTTLKPTIFLVPFFAGEKTSLQRHIDFLEGLGYPTRFVKLTFSAYSFLKRPISSRSHRFGMKGIWADEIEQALNQTPGKKIIFSFSNPTLGAIEAIARRNASDVIGLMADGGPTGELWTSIMNFYVHEKPLPTWPLRALSTTLSTLMIEPHFRQLCHDDLDKFPAGFPILSIRGWKDPLISSRQIDLIFDPHKQLHWQKLSIPEAGHLNGLRDFPEDYRWGVEKFLEKLIT